MAIKTFEEYFSDYNRFRNSSPEELGCSKEELDEMNKGIINNAKKLYKKLKTPAAILNFERTEPEDRRKYLKGTDINIDVDFFEICACARDYADYKSKNEPYTFDEYVEGRRIYGVAKIDKEIIEDAKTIYETLKTQDGIEEFSKSSYEKQHKEFPSICSDRNSSCSFSYVCQIAMDYAGYAEEYIKPKVDEKEQQNSDVFRLQEIRNKKSGR